MCDIYLFVCVSPSDGVMGSEGSEREKSSAVQVQEKRGKGQRDECQQGELFLAVTVLPASTLSHAHIHK